MKTIAIAAALLATGLGLTTLGGCAASTVDAAQPEPISVAPTVLPSADDAKLTRALTSDETSERQAAAHAIRERRTASQAHVNELTAALGDEDVDVRVAATRALGALGDAALPAADRLERLAGWATDLGQRYEAALALARIPSAPEHLERLLVDPAARQAITTAFSGMGAEGRAALAGLMQSTRWRTRAAAVSALARAPNAVLSDVSAALARCLRDDSSAVRVAALRALPRLSGASLVRIEDVERALGDMGSATERAALCVALAAPRQASNRADPSVLAAATLWALESDTQRERLLGVRLAYRAGVSDEQVHLALAGNASSQDVAVARESAACLRLLGGARSLSFDVADALRAALQHDRARVVTEAAAALMLGGHDAPDLSEPLTRLLVARRWTHGTMGWQPFRPRYRNLRAGGGGGPAGTDRLPPVRLLTLDDLAPLLSRHADATRTALRPLLASDDSAARANAAWMAADTLPPNRVDALLTPLLDDSDPAVRFIAGLRLVRLDLQTERVVCLFVETLLADPGVDHDVRLGWDRELIAELARNRHIAVSTLVTGYSALVKLEGTEAKGSFSYDSPTGDRHARAILAALGVRGQLLLIDEMLEDDLKRRYVSANLLRRAGRLSHEAAKRLRELTSHADVGALARSLLKE